ncbi:MAG: hypothetical protein ABDI19_02300 [Armatimonadota bacterium]
MSGRPIPPNRRWQQNRSRRAPPSEPIPDDLLESELFRRLLEDQRFHALLEEHLRRMLAAHQMVLQEALRHERASRRPPRQMSWGQRILLGIGQITLILTLSWGIGQLVGRLSPQEDAPPVISEASGIMSHEESAQPQREGQPSLADEPQEEEEPHPTDSFESEDAPSTNIDSVEDHNEEEAGD